MIIHGTGCCLIDFLYAGEDFSGPAFRSCRSRKAGDGGLKPGTLVFAEDFERFTGKPYEEALAALTGGKKPDSHNLGGPSSVSLAHAAQVLGSGHGVSFFGVRGNDETGLLLEDALSRLPFAECTLLLKDGVTPRTDVLSDPSYDEGHGERTFINLLGTAAGFCAGDLPPSFFDAHIIAFGGTSLVPRIHGELTELLKKARGNGAVTAVNLVYDYRSEQQAGNEKWKLGFWDDAYQYIDILIADREEALKTSGRSTAKEAADWFISRGTGAAVISDGARPVVLASGKGLFLPLERQTMDVNEAVNRDLARFPERRGDTTGCGDNFAGGVIAGIAEQMTAVKPGRLDLREACIPGIAAGGFACFTLGGTFYESRPGEKKELLQPYIDDYRRQCRSGLSRL
jgi:sugar/nucleoside kinase (ribokinase family)